MTRLVAAVLVLSALGCERVEWLGKEAEKPPLAPDVPRLVSALSDPDARDTDPTLTGDLLELYFMSDRSGSKDLWTARRESPEEPWSAPSPVESLNSDVVEENPHVSVDGLRLWFYSDRDRSVGTLWLATRESSEDSWGEPSPVPELGIGLERSNVSLAVAENETLAVVNSLPTGGQGYELYEHTRESVDEPFGEPIHLAEVGSEVDDFDPEVRANGLFLAFDSRRLGSADIFRANRETTEDAFAEPRPVDALNSAYEDTAPAISLEFSYVVFSSDREGSVDIFEAHWPDSMP
jgi:hypothetical protein